MIPIETLASSSCICIFFCAGNGACHWYYDLDFNEPTYAVYEKPLKLQLNVYRCLFASRKFCGYLRIYPNAMKASDTTNLHKATITTVTSISELDDKEAQPCLPKELFDNILSPFVMHPGLSQLLEGAEGYNDGFPDIDALEIRHETIRTELFRRGLRFFIRNTNYIVGSNVGLSSEIKGCYSMYGRSMNDICITRKQLYRKNNLTGGILHVSHSNPDDDENPDDYENPDDCDCPDAVLNLGVLECKRRYHAYMIRLQKKCLKQLETY